MQHQVTIFPTSVLAVALASRIICLVVLAMAIEAKTLNKVVRMVCVVRRADFFSIKIYTINLQTNNYNIIK